jgi:23S rRNA pseudouridine2605 synthase
MGQGLSIRLQKYIADAGITSRRKAEMMIICGKVKVNGEVCRELGTKVDVDNDIVQIGHDVVNPESVERLYVVMNKPRSVLTTVSDPEGRETVMDHLGGLKVRVFPVGRLDYLSEGLLILTNDGELANMIMHPKYEINKVYEVKIFGLVNEGILNNLRKGIYGPDGLLQPKSVRVIEQLPNKTWLEFRLAEGKNREIRRICDAVGVTIDKLRRVAIERLSIDGLNPGEWRMHTRKEMLSMLGIKANGEKLVTSDYVSSKKSVPFNKRMKYRTNNGKAADDKEFRKFKKDRYFATIEREKEAQAAYELAKLEAQNKPSLAPKPVFRKPVDLDEPTTETAATPVKRSFERKPFERKPFERKPFERKPFEKKSFDRKPDRQPMLRSEYGADMDEDFSPRGRKPSSRWD